MSERKPLTLEELRNMDGKPVWCKYIGDTTFPDQWMVVNAKMEKCGNADWGLPFEDNPDDAYGKTWLAYAYEPPRLDRSAWEPCEYCREQDREVYKTQDYPGICSLEVAQDGPDEIVVNAYNHNTPLTEDICFSFPVLFCPKCGRPLTDAAWKTLEKRLDGAANGD